MVVPQLTLPDGTRLDHQRPGSPGRWLLVRDRDTGKLVYIELLPGWRAVLGWPWWAKLFPATFTGLCDPTPGEDYVGTIWIRPRPGEIRVALQGFLHELGHALQAMRLGAMIYRLHAIRYVLRFGYKGSRLERGADAFRDRVLATFREAGSPVDLPLEMLLRAEFLPGKAA